MSDSIPTHIADDELAALLKSAAKSNGRIKVIAEGKPYEIEVRQAPRRDIREGYDPIAARGVWRSIHGILPDVDAEAWIKEVKESREQDSTLRPAK